MGGESRGGGGGSGGVLQRVCKNSGGRVSVQNNALIDCSFCEKLNILVL